jgi:acyl-CoA dehydrogenase
MAMNFSMSDEQQLIEAQIERLCAKFDDAYWHDADESGRFPEEFYRAIAEGGWLGIGTPKKYGGSELGMTEAAIMMRTIAGSGACMTGCSSIHMNIFGLRPVIMFGTDAQKARMLPPLIRGENKACFAVTEPNVGLNTTRISTSARRKGDKYIISGSKIWISTAQVATHMLLLVRTTPFEEVQHKTDGLSLFYTPFDRSRIEIRPIPKMGRHAVDSNMLFIDNLEVPADDLIGAEGEGFRRMIPGFNSERIIIASEAVGIGRVALRKAVQYAKERVVFDRPIGQNQGIQHPLAACWMNLEAANLMVLHAATLYDAHRECGPQANAAKYLAAEAAFTACETAVMTLGGMGYSREYHVERYLRESLIPRIAPVSPHMIMNFIAEKVLGLPKSY